jgi:hypothetical protein
MPAHHTAGYTQIVAEARGPVERAGDGVIIRLTVQHGLAVAALDEQD